MESINILLRILYEFTTRNHHAYPYFRDTVCDASRLPASQRHGCQRSDAGTEGHVHVIQDVLRSDADSVARRRPAGAFRGETYNILGAQLTVRSRGDTWRVSQQSLRVVCLAVLETTTDGRIRSSVFQTSIRVFTLTLRR